MLSTLRSLRTDTPQAMTRHRMFAVAVALTLPTVVSAQVGARRTPLFAVDARAVARLDSVARATLVTHKLAGLSVAVVRDGRELLVRAYGKADLALGVPTPDDAVYEIGSVTKQFTAAAVLQLVEAGRLSLDADIATLLPSYNAQGRRITLRRLLDHTSGIPGYTEMSEFGALMTQPLPRDSLVTLIGSKGFNFEPGTAMRYNNSAYFLLGLIPAVLLHGLWNGSLFFVRDFFGYYALVQFPLFVLAVVIVVYLRRKESAITRQRLSEYAAAGWFDPAELGALATAPGRRVAMAWARQRGVGPIMKSYIRDSTRLAFARHRLLSGRTDAWGEADGSARADESALLQSVVASRQALQGGIR